MLRSLACLLVLALAACDAAPGDDPAGSRSDFEAASTLVPTALKLGADWSETASGPIVAGGTVSVDYDVARLPNCRASHNGNPGWQITASMLFLPGNTIVEKGIMTYEQTPTGPNYYTWIHTVPEFEVPVGTSEIQVWFMNGSGFDHPCTEWDSDYGTNYRFQVIDATSVGSMLFQSDWRSIQGGTVKRGGKLLVTYAPERMKTIVSQAQLSGMGYFAVKYHCYGYGCCSWEYDDKLHVRFSDGGDFASYPIGDLAVELTIPADASRVEIYFDTDVYTTTWYCGGAEGQKYRQPDPDRFYDSNYGDNFVYSIP
jgi:hypothetical protein